MNPSRRRLLKLLPLSMCGAGLAACAGPGYTGLLGSQDTIDVSVRIQDETGNPIPYVTVWRFVQLSPEHDQHRDLRLNMEDLWRCTQRYRETFEYVLFYGLLPVPYLGVPVMGDISGVFQEGLDYQHETGKGNHYHRPDPLAFGYTFMKRGYFPGKTSFTVPKGKDSVEAVVTLKRDPSEPLDDQPYMQTLDRVRFELSDTRKNTIMTGDTQKRLDEIRHTLEQAAQQALAAGDRKSAARIYLRMRYLPNLEYMNGKIIGFAQTDVSSDYSKQVFQRACELDPDNLFVRMETILDSPPEIRGKPEGIRFMISKIEAIIAQYGESAWPDMYSIRAGAYGNVGEYEKARQLYLEAAKLEPKYTDWNKKIDRLKWLMKTKGVPVPANW